MSHANKRILDRRIHSSQLAALIGVTFRELIRQKVLWILVAFTIFLGLLGMALAQLSLANAPRIALDVGLTVISLCMGVMTCILSSTLIQREIHERTLYLVLSKGIRRSHYIWGKSLGLLTVLFFILSLMCLFLFSLIGLFSTVAITRDLLFVVTTMVAEVTTLCFLGIFFSTFASSLFSAIFSMSLWLVGHAHQSLDLTRQKSGGLPKLILDVAGLLIPNFESMDLKLPYSAGIPLEWGHVGAAWSGTILFVGTIVLVASVIFSGRDL